MAAATKSPALDTDTDEPSRHQFVSPHSSRTQSPLGRSMSASFDVMEAAIGKSSSIGRRFLRMQGGVNDSMNKAQGVSTTLSESRARVSAEGHNTWMHHKIDWILGTGGGKIFAFSFVFLLIFFGGSVAWLFFIDHDDEHDWLILDWNFEASLWMSWTLVFDPGVHTGIPAHVNTDVHVVAMVFSLLGFMFFLVVLGIVVDMVRSALDYSAEVCSRVVDNNHTLVLGWGNRAIYLLQELLAAYQEDRNKVTGCCGRRRRKRIVILANRPKFEVQQEINMYFRKDDSADGSSARFIQYRQGDPTDWKELEKVSASSADDILILRSNGTPQSSDNHVTQCCLALSALSNDTVQTVTGEIFAEVQNPRILGMVRACNASGVVLRRTAVRMLCHQCLYPAVGEALQEMISFTEHHVYLAQKIPQRLHGKTLLRANMDYPEGVLIGTRTSSGDPPQLSLVFISNGEPKYRPRTDAITFKKMASFAHGKRKHPTAGSSGSGVAVEVNKLSDADCAEPAADPPARPYASREPLADIDRSPSSDSQPANLLAKGDSKYSGFDIDAHDTDDPKSTADSRRSSAFEHQDVLQQTGRNAIIMIGSPSDISLYVWSLQTLAPSRVGSPPLELHILTTFTEKVTNKVLVDKAKGSVTWYVGDSTDQHDLQSLPLQKAACILVTAFQLDEDEPAAPTDARSLSTVFQLRELLNGEDYAPQIVCELMDIRSKLLVESPAFKGTASFFHSVRVETALFATAADDTQVFNMLMLLVEPNGMDLFVVTADQLRLSSGRTESSETSEDNALGEHNFWSLREQIALDDPESVLIGWKKGEEEPGEPGEWEINPKDKERKFVLTRSRLLAILKCKAPEKRASMRSSKTSSFSLDKKVSADPVGKKVSADPVAGVFEVPLTL